MHAALQNEDNNSGAETEFFEDGRDHQRAVAGRVRADEEKGDLPGQPQSHESIKEAGMRDRRGIFSADEIKNEIERGNDQQTPEARKPKNKFCEIYWCLPRAKNGRGKAPPHKTHGKNDPRP